MFPDMTPLPTYPKPQSGHGPSACRHQSCPRYKCKPGWEMRGTISEGDDPPRPPLGALWPG